MQYDLLVSQSADESGRAGVTCQEHSSTCGSLGSSPSLLRWPLAWRTLSSSFPRPNPSHHSDHGSNAAFLGWLVWPSKPAQYRLLEICRASFNFSVSLFNYLRNYFINNCLPVDCPRTERLEPTMVLLSCISVFNREPSAEPKMMALIVYTKYICRCVCLCINDSMTYMTITYICIYIYTHI